VNTIPEPSAQLLADAVDGGDALNSIISDISQPVYRFCLSMLADPALAEDAAQDSLIKICSSLETFENRSKFSTWAYRIAANRCLDLLRRKKSRPEDSLDAIVETHDGDESLASGSGDAESAMLADKLLVEAALAKLEPEQRSVLVLREISGLSYDEIAETLAIPAGTVKSRIFRARQELLSVLKELMPEEKTALGTF